MSSKIEFPTLTSGPSLNQETNKQTGGKRRGLGPRNDVLTSCKAVTLRGGQWVIAVFFPQKILLEFLEARSEPAEEIRNA